MKFFNDGQYFFLNVDTIDSKYYYIVEGICNLYLCKCENGKPVGKRHFLFELSNQEVMFPLPIVDNMSVLVIPTNDMKIDETQSLEVDILLEKKSKFVEGLANSLNFSKVKTEELTTNLTNENFDNFLNDYTKNIINLINDDYKKRLNNNKISLEKQKNTYYNSFNILSSVLKNKQEKELLLNNTNDLEDYLFKACKMVTKYLKIQIKMPLYLQKGFKVENPLQEIAFSSKFRTRKIILENNWYENPTLPYISYLKYDNTPVALIPTTFGYKMYNPKYDTIIKVNKSIEKTINLEDCHIIYRNLPLNKITSKNLLKFMLDGIRRIDLLGMVLAGVAGGLLSAISPLIVSWIFDSIIPDANQTLLKELAVVLISVTCVQFIFELIRSFIVMRIQVFSEIDIQSAIWDRLLSLPTGFFKKYSPGELAKKIDGLSDISQIISGNIINQVLSFIFGLFYVFVMFYINSNLAVISLIVVLLIAIISIILGFGEINYYNQIVNLSADLSGRMISWLNGITKIRTAGAESRIFRIWSEKFTKITNLDLNRSKIHNVSKIFCSAISIVVSMCLYFYIIKSNNSQLNSGMFIAFNTALTVVLSNFIVLTDTIIEFNEVIPLYKNIKPILEESSEYDDTKEDIGEITGDIEISHISFRYSKDTPLVLKDISFNIRQGEHIALVGTSGSGKSTMLRILLGFENAESGQIYFNGKDISQFDIRSLRKQLGVVLQTGQLISGSIFENVVGSSTTLTVSDVENALAKAGILDEINAMPMGIHTMISEDFGTISGGQKQRILIARALVSNPKVLFFDEATSALDNRTQKVVSDSINDLNITRITIAHRLSTITGCDRIIVLDDGRIVEEGSYNELINKKGIFFKMSQRQII